MQLRNTVYNIEFGVILKFPNAIRTKMGKENNIWKQ